MPYENRNVTLQASGVIGNSVAANTTICLINAPGPGKFKIWGSVRHTLPDGVKMTSPVVGLIICSAANDTAQFGPLVFDFANNTSGIILALNTATGASDTASAILFAERID